MKDFIRKNVFTIPLVSLLAIGISGSAIAWHQTHPEQVAVEAPPAEASTVNWSETPAADSIRNAISAIPADWTRRGEQLSSVTPPFPLSCNVGGIQSSYSVSQQYNNGITVALASYTAGTGAIAYQTQRANSRKCVDGNTAVSNIKEAGIGSEAFTIQVRRGVATSQTTVFRRGDMIGFVLVDGGASAAPAKTVDSILATAMNGQCLNENSTPEDGKRTLWSGAEFTGLLAEKNVSVGEWKLPSIPKAATYKATALPAPDPQVPAVTLPKIPEYPVWPKLPETKEHPKLPVAPPAQPVTEKTVLNRVADDIGPGCGWEFTGTVKPVFNEEEITAANSQIVETARAELRKGAEEWSKTVLTYWEAMAGYSKSVEEYEKFRTEVIKVDEAWKPIHEQWRSYYTAFANYEAAVKARDAFIARKAAAQKNYDAAVEVCNAPEPTESPKPSVAPSPVAPKPAPKETTAPAPVAPAPAPTTEPTAPAPAPTATEPAKAESIQMDRMTLTAPMVREGCPAPRPAILDENAPDAPTEPSKPANPIPEDKR